MVWIIAGCATPYKMYDGEPRQPSEVVLLGGGYGIQSLRIDGIVVPEEARFLIHLLPGRHDISAYFVLKKGSGPDPSGKWWCMYRKKGRGELSFEGLAGHQYKIRVHAIDKTHEVVQIYDSTSRQVVVQTTPSWRVFFTPMFPNR